MSVPHSFARLAATVAAAVLSAGVWAGSAAADTPDPAAAIARAERAATSVDALTSYDQAVEALRRLGVQPFLWPSVSPNCGATPAVAGAVPGPWPQNVLAVPGLDLAGVKAGQTLFAFVPMGLAPDGPDTSGMQVAWFNTATGRGGMAPMGPLSGLVDILVPPQIPEPARGMAESVVHDFLARMLPAGGVRVVPVDTGSGTVLSLMFGTVRDGAQTCFFLPTVGITTVP
ncbi:hypothetical protein ACFYTQ_16970 [Nocardia sp. NPDC004068]|uniref:hypothetical protein n=1 Tax=Nocardia sp. NPDC004068 TaxID=3364303 RepID=UPI00368FE6FA